MISQHQYQEVCDELQAAQEKIEQLEAQLAYWREIAHMEIPNG